MTNIIGLKSSC